MIYLFLAEGFEEIEAITPVDILRRAGMDVKTVSITDSLTVLGAHGIELSADITLNNFSLDDAELLILPGGSVGTENLKSCTSLCTALCEFSAREGYIAAICAAPTILSHLGLLKGRRATCYPSLAEELTRGGAKYKSDKVVLDKNFITSEGPGTSADFAFALCDKFIGKRETDKLRLSMVF